MPFFIVMKKKIKKEKVINLDKDPIFRHAIEFNDKIDYSEIMIRPPETETNDDEESETTGE